MTNPDPGVLELSPFELHEGPRALMQTAEHEGGAQQAATGRA